VVFTDHQPLVGALARASEPKSDRQRHQLSFISEFTADIRHIASQANVVADTLSRPAPVAREPVPGPSSLLSSGPQAGSTVGVATAGLLHRSYAEVVAGSAGLSDGVAAAAGPPSRPPPPIGVAAAAGPPSRTPPPIGVAASAGPPSRVPPPAGQLPLDIQLIAAAQANCPDCQQAVQSPVLKVVKVSLEGQQVLVDVSSGVMWPLVPAQFRRAIFKAVHNLSHPGIRATKRLVSSRYLWPI
jgi:Integrase zinc binding domain